ncbi:type II toxin-antitoxin system toxin DNA ADP-ribosyl transferase DarT [Hyphomicrobium sp.]|uniref:type II toxin-antitoxin system toxin DNA ADP-ribosyl transferase DarT n=1 Tax=Hyphomicrobium sp. TaxID=82 RepID=UPI002FE2FE62
MALEATLDHLLHNVLAAAADYEAAEQALTQAYKGDSAPAAWEAAARAAKRRAAEVAIAIDGLTFSPMMYNIKTGWAGIRKRDNDEIVIIVSSLRTLHAAKLSFLFTDRHAYLAAARFFSDLARLDQIDWEMLQRRDFRNDPDDPSKMERYQAEALVHKYVPLDALSGFVCYSDEVRESLAKALAERKQTMKVVKRPSWYF